jgi:RimJ/RimL family protein N-acetyltransferase
MTAPSTTLLRPLTGADAETFSALRRQVTADNPVPMGLTLEEELTRPLQGFRDQLSYPAPNAAIGAFDGDALVGCAALAWPSKFASSPHKTTLWGTFVAPTHRRQGSARALVQRVIAHAHEHGVRRINLLVYLPNAQAVGLYASLGFVACGLEPEAICLDGRFHDGQHMSLLLAT